MEYLQEINFDHGTWEQPTAQQAELLASQLMAARQLITNQAAQRAKLFPTIATEQEFVVEGAYGRKINMGITTWPDPYDLNGVCSILTDTGKTSESGSYFVSTSFRPSGFDVKGLGTGMESYGNSCLALSVRKESDLPPGDDLVAAAALKFMIAAKQEHQRRKTLKSPGQIQLTGLQQEDVAGTILRINSYAASVAMEHMNSPLLAGVLPVYRLGNALLGALLDHHDDTGVSLVSLFNGAISQTPNGVLLQDSQEGLVAIHQPAGIKSDIVLSSAPVPHSLDEGIMFSQCRITPRGVTGNIIFGDPGSYSPENFLNIARQLDAADSGMTLEAYGPQEIAAVKDTLARLFSKYVTNSHRTI